jgi:hypothetical protein
MTTQIAAPEHPAITAFKSKANHLKSLLKGREPAVSHGESLDILSKIEGRKKGWNEMSAELNAQVLPEEFTRRQNTFFSDELLPRLSSLAEKAGLALPKPGALSSEDAGERQTTLEIQLSKDLQMCRLFGDIKISNQNIDWHWGHLELSFPLEASLVAVKLLGSEVLTDDLTPTLTRRFNHGSKEEYCLSLDVYGPGTTARKGYFIWDDQERLAEFFAGYSEELERIEHILRAFHNLAQNWKSSKFFRSLEDAIWSAFEETPRYHAKPKVFHTMKIGGITLEGYASEFGTHIRGSQGGVQIGAGEIIFLDESRSDGGTRRKMLGFCIAKYGNDFEPRISLAGLSTQEILEVVKEFGISLSFDVLDRLGIPKDRGSLSRYHDKMFYDSPAFQGLVKWVRKHPKLAKDYAKGDAPHLPDWYQSVQDAMSRIAE